MQAFETAMKNFGEPEKERFGFLERITNVFNAFLKSCLETGREEEMRYYHEQYPNLALETIEGYTFYWGEGLWQAVPSE
jgi:hypothetical protein